MLVTKIHPPRLRSRLVHRERLLRRLEVGRNCALTLLCAPAGFGKTTLLVDWLTSRKPDDGHPTAVAWMSLDDADNDPIKFVRLLIAALHATHPRIGRVLDDALAARQSPPLRTLLGLLLNHLVASGNDVTLVLEDFHVIHRREIHDAVAFLLENSPAVLHLVMATREDPPVPLSRLRVSAMLCELRAGDLRFTLDEAAVFAEDVAAHPLARADLTALVTRTEGWIGGLQLAMLSMPFDGEAVSHFVEHLTASRRHMLDYLADEVLSRQPPAIVKFLLHTSILDRLSAPLCEAVLGVERLEDAGVSFAQVERRNLFLSSLDDHGTWYRYHRLFADLLRARLRQTSPELFAELHGRASRWYELQGFPDEAIQHALFASDIDRAGRLVESSAFEWLARGNIYAVLNWCRRLPDSLTKSAPSLSFLHAYALLLANQPHSAEALLAATEQQLSGLQSQDARGTLGRITLVRATAALMRGDLDRAVAGASEAQAMLAPEDVLGQVDAQLHAAYAFCTTGDVGAANERAVSSVVERAERLKLPVFERVSQGLLARFYMKQGRLRRADAMFGRALRAAPANVTLGAPICYLGRGELLREWDVCDSAVASLQQGLDAISEDNLVDAWVAAEGYYSVARVRQAQGDGRGAMTALDEAVALGRQREFVPQVSAYIAGARARLWLMQGDCLAAERWALECGLSPEDPVSYPREMEYGVLARVLLGKKDPLVTSLLDRLLADAERGGRVGSVVELLTLTSLAWHALGDRTRTFAALARALALGEPEGYVRVFVDEGAPMAALLRRARVQGIAPEYSARLLQALGEPAGHRGPAPGASDGPWGIQAPHEVPTVFIEPLTDREQEVLRLLISGASNQEIAHTLTVTLGTVKQHVHRIFGKFGVRSRTQAILRAKTLSLD